MFSTLSDLEVGKVGVLDTYAISPLHKKMLSMGLLPGQSIAVLRRLPFKGSLYVQIDGRNLAFRHEEAKQIRVKI